MMIESRNNPRIKHLAALLKKSSLRAQERLYVAEGVRSCGELLPGQISELYISEGRKDLAGMFPAEPVFVSDSVMESVSDTKNSQGVIAVVKMKENRQPVFKKDGLYLLTDDIRDPGNLGTMLRLAEAAGIDACVLSSGTADPYNPKVVRATMGALQRVDFFIADDLAGVIDRMKASGVCVYGAVLEGYDYAGADFKKGTAFVIGNEANGISERVRNACSELIRIPMHGQTESLNAAVAAAVLSFEASRQRRL